MTREEQLDWLYRLRSEIYVYMPKEWIVPMNDALDMAIKALEQEPKTGHWIGYNQAFWIYAKCSECGSVQDAKSQYCPTCGCLMEYEEETE